MIDKEKLPASEKKTLRNRFYAAKNRAETTTTPFHWETFSDWLTDFCALAPEGFTSEDFRLSYDNQSPEGYAPSTMRFAPSKRKRAEDTRRSFLEAQGISFEPVQPQAEAKPVLNLNGVSDLQRMLFTAELTLRLKSFQVDQTFEEIVWEAAGAAGIELKAGV